MRLAQKERRFSLEFSLEEQINQQIKVKIIWLWNLACALRRDPSRVRTRTLTVNQICKTVLQFFNSSESVIFKRFAGTAWCPVRFRVFICQLHQVDGNFVPACAPTSRPGMNHHYCHFDRPPLSQSYQLIQLNWRFTGVSNLLHEVHEPLGSTKSSSSNHSVNAGEFAKCSIAHKLLKLL